MDDEIIVEQIKEVEGLLTGDLDEAKVRDAEELLHSLTITVPSVVDRIARDGYRCRIKEFKARIDQWRRTRLMASGVATHTEGDAKVQQRDQTEMLEDSLRQLHGCEQNGKQILQNLDEQKAKITGMRTKIKGVDKELGYSNKLIERMKKWWRR